MKVLSFIAGCILLFTSCDPSRIYEKNIDLEQRCWPTSEKPVFDFVIEDATIKYNLFVNIRNEVSYNNANLYFTYYLADSTGSVLEKKLINKFLFDKKTGKPFGKTVLGDIYDHRFILLDNYAFDVPGRYIMRYEHFMRTDTLCGVMAVGLRVEKVGQ